MSRRRIGRILIRESQIPVGGGQRAEGADEREEDEHENGIRAKGADKEDKGDKGDEEEKEREASVEGRRLKPKRVARVAVRGGQLGRGGDIGAVGVEPGDEGHGEGDEEGA